MHPAVTVSFKAWLQGVVNIKLNSDTVITGLTYEGSTDTPFLKSDKKWQL